MDHPEYILVTGGAGYIGSHFVRLLVEEGRNVVVLDDLSNGNIESVHNKAEFLEGDYGNVKILNNIFKKYKVTCIVHFAAFAYVGESVKKPLKYYNNNVSKTISLLSVMENFDVKKLIFSSSCATYGIPESLPITEDLEQNPINPYGKTKLMIESILADCAYAWSLKYVVLRYFNACGASDDSYLGEKHNPETHLVPLTIKAAMNDVVLKVFGTDYATLDGTCVRDYVHVLDLASAHLKAINYLDNEHCSLSCNLGSNKGYSIKEIINAVELVTKKKIRFSEEERREGDPAELVADATLAMQSLNWKPHHSSLENIITSACNWHKKEMFYSS